MRSSRPRTRFATVAAITVVSTILGGAAAQAASSGALVAPYEGASSEHDCTSLGGCAAGADVNGSMNVHASAVASTTYGTSTPVVTSARATVVAIHEITEAANSLTYTVHVHFSEGYAYGSGRYEDDYGDWHDSSAGLSLRASAQHGACESCRGSSQWGISAPYYYRCDQYWCEPSGAAYAPSDVSFILTVSNQDGGAVPAGTVSMSVNLEASASAQAHSGRLPWAGVDCQPFPPYPHCPGPWVDGGASSSAEAKGVGQLTSIDYVMEPASTPNLPPTARLTASCVRTDCQFAGGGSSDPDGWVTGYSWDFGDGTSSPAGASVQHRYPEGTASYTATLTVTDNRGGTDTESLTVKCTRKNQNKPTTCS